MGEITEIPLRLKSAGAMGRWLAYGYALFRRYPGISMSFAAIFVVPGLALEYWLLATDYALYYFILAAGFVLLVPFLFAPYYHLATAVSRGQAPPVLPGVLFRTPPAVLGLGMISGALFLIWATDAFIIYSVYFSFDPLPGLFRGGEAGSRAVSFLGWATLLGAVLSLIILFITPFSIPHAIDDGSGFVDAIVFSVKGVARNAAIVAPWVALLGAATLLTTLIALPLGLALFPLLAYANYDCYRELAAKSGAAGQGAAPGGSGRAWNREKRRTE
ncbi:MAG TPA: DUF2189 domain-containing protein [Sedimenticola thiotaurini]|uniref:DUF2189 domain-containing protein n=1 Tax=Sedimenticola thiotaurini TaxID=1543721 RepID=A0A831RJA8_9GAMM|nr:DUF2189 domain-containing protein [Sedimenticola thiotaurini]